MKTEVVMKRNLLGYEIRQRHQSGYFYTTDLEIVANRIRLEEGLPMLSANVYFGLPSTKEFLRVLSHELGKESTEFIRGKGKGRCVHPYVFLDLALWFNPKFKVKVYKWLFDNLLQIRDNSGDSYKTMAEAIVKNFEVAGKLPIIITRTAKLIRKACGLSLIDVGVWEKASSDQLFIRDKIQNTVSTLAYVSSSPEEAINNAINIVAEQHPDKVKIAKRPTAIKRIIKKNITETLLAQVQ